MTAAFISFEGGEGSGKTTQIELLRQAFARVGRACVKTREPGGSAGAERIRNLLVHGDAYAWDPVAETALFYAGRVDHVVTLIKPALERGEDVLCDRFIDSTLVYQGIGKGLSEDYIRSLHALLLGNFMPDLTLLLDIDPQIGLKRAAARAGDETRFEALGLDFHQRVRTGFLSVAERDEARCMILNAAQTVEALHAQIIDTVNRRLGYGLTQ